MSVETKQWMPVQRGGERCVLAVVTVTVCHLLRHGPQALVHHWQKCTANGGDYAEK